MWPLFMGSRFTLNWRLFGQIDPHLPDASSSPLSMLWLTKVISARNLVDLDSTKNFCSHRVIFRNVKFWLPQFSECRNKQNSNSFVMIKKNLWIQAPFLFIIIIFIIIDILLIILIIIITTNRFIYIVFKVTVNNKYCYLSIYGNSIVGFGIGNLKICFHIIVVSEYQNSLPQLFESEEDNSSWGNVLWFNAKQY